jgi:hypothetical protein
MENNNMATVLNKYVFFFDIVYRFSILTENADFGNVIDYKHVSIFLHILYQTADFILEIANHDCDAIFKNF